MDELNYCNPLVGKEDKLLLSKGMKKSPLTLETSESRKYFPFKQGGLFVATLRVGTEGIHMTVDGKHVTAFAYRDVMSSSLKNHIVFLSHEKYLYIFYHKCHL